MVTSQPPAWQAGATIAIILGAFGLMASERAAPDMVMIGALICLLTLGIISAAEATAGFAQQGLLTIMVLFAVTTGLERTGAFEPVRKLIIPRKGARSTPVHELLARFVLPVTLLSAFLNNTPVVALFISTVKDLALKAGLPPSKLLMPLSTAAILGGTCTLIGTSTNLVLLSMAQRAVFEQTGERFEFGFFEIGQVGLPVVCVCLLFVFTCTPFLLASRAITEDQVADSRDYTLSAQVGEGSSLIGKTVEDAGFNSIVGCTLFQIVRSDVSLPTPAPSEQICAGDVLVLTGQIDGIVQLMRAPRKGIRELLRLTHLGQADGCAQNASAPSLARARAQEVVTVEPAATTSERARASEQDEEAGAVEASAGGADGAEADGGAAGVTTTRSDAPASGTAILAAATPGGELGVAGARSSAPPDAVPAAAATPCSNADRLRAILASLRPQPHPKLVEVILGPRSRILGKPCSRFPELLSATVVAIARDEESANSTVHHVASNFGLDMMDAYMFAHRMKDDDLLTQPTADITLRAGDSLLLLTTAAFLDGAKKDGPHAAAFSKVRELTEHAPPRYSRALIAVLLALGMVITSIAARESVPLLLAAAICVGLMLICGCLSADDARSAFRIDIFLVIGSAFGLSQAMVNSGAASSVARALVSAGGAHFGGMITLLYLVTALLTEVITNNAAVALMFPIAYEAHLEAPDVLPLRPLIYALMLAASASFITPTGYQTNLMIFKPGGYKWLDFPRIGLPLQLVAMGASIGSILTIEVWYMWVIAPTGLLALFFVLARLFPKGCYAGTAYRNDENLMVSSPQASSRV